MVILGGTGACGRELISLLEPIEEIKEIIIPCRWVLEQWKDKEYKLKIITTLDLADYL